MNKQNNGFTLIELMIVIAIIAILMAYAVPAYRAYTVKTKAAEAFAVSANLKTTVAEIWFLGNQMANIHSNTHGIGAPNYYVGDWVEEVNVSAGVITAVYNSDDPVLAGNSTSIVPVLPGNGSNTGQGLMWECQTTLSTQYDPC